MKRLLAILMCLVLLSVAALAEEASLPGRQIIADEIVVTVGDQTFEPDLTAVLEGAPAEDGELVAFRVEHAGEELLPVQVKLSGDGASVMLGDSQVYCFAPEWFAGLTGEDKSTAESFGELLGAHVKELPELAFGFVAFLDAQPEDEFLLDMPLLTEWLAAELEVDEGALSALNDIRLPEISIARDAIKYSITVDGESPMLFSLTRDDQMISLKNSDIDFRIGVQVHRDGSVQASALTSEAYSHAKDKSLLIKYSYAPADEGGAKFTLSAEYDDSWLYYDWGQTFVYAEGTISPDGALDGKIRITDDGQLLNLFVPTAVQLHLTAENASIEDRMAGKAIQTIHDYNDESMNLFTLAVIGLMGDAEKLISDPEIQAIAEAHNALFLETYGEEYSEAFPN